LRHETTYASRLARRRLRLVLINSQSSLAPTREPALLVTRVNWRPAYRRLEHRSELLASNNVEKTERIEQPNTINLSRRASFDRLQLTALMNAVFPRRLQPVRLLLIQADDIAVRGFACLVAHVADPGEQLRLQQVNIFA
jgi:hypothetical protein